MGASAEGALRNPTGFGETVKLSYGHSNTGSRDFQVNVHAPTVTPNKWSLNATARLYEDNAPQHFSSFSKNMGSLSIHMATLNGKHKVSMACAVRDEVAPSAPRDEQSIKQWAHDKVETSKLFSSDMMSFPSVAPKSAGEGPGHSSAPSSLGPLEFPMNFKRFASPGILHSLSPSTKTNIEYTFIPVDTRSSPVNPSRGHMVKGIVEVAVPPGTARFARMEVTGEKHMCLGDWIHLGGLKNVTLSFCGSFGSSRLLDFNGNSLLGPTSTDLRHREYSASGERRQLNVSDRFFLGGPSSLRGLHLYGSGPRSASASLHNNLAGDSATASDALGGMSRIAGLVCASAPLPFNFTSSENMRTMVFANYGALLPHSLWPMVPLSACAKKGPSSTVWDILDPFRLTLGCGFSYALGPARLELTYALPVRASSHDILKPFQIGIGLSMNN